MAVLIWVQGARLLVVGHGLTQMLAPCDPEIGDELVASHRGDERWLARRYRRILPAGEV